MPFNGCPLVVGPRRGPWSLELGACALNYNGADFAKMTPHGISFSLITPLAKHQLS